jgi:hypothetical protein
MRYCRMTAKNKLRCEEEVMVYLIVIHRRNGEKYGILLMTAGCGFGSFGTTGIQAPGSSHFQATLTRLFIAVSDTDFSPAPGCARI